jgi:hypothetical protein
LSGGAISITVDEIFAELRLAAGRQRVRSLQRVGAASPALGVGLPALRSLAKQIGREEGGQDECRRH